MKKVITEMKDALRAIPGVVTAIFVLSVVSMNLLANKSVFNLPWLASTAGIFVSWVSFLCMDAVCKRFGSKAANYMNITAMLLSFIAAVMYMLIVKIPGTWAATYGASSPEVAAEMNAGLDSTFSSAWYIIIGSAIAMFLGGLVNSIMNKIVGSKVDKNDTFGGFAIRSFISTAAGQFVDNFAFAMFVSYIFFGWSIKQVLVCSFMMMLLELLFEAVFSPIGFKLSQNWKKENVGHEYIAKYNTVEEV